MEVNKMNLEQFKYQQERQQSKAERLEVFTKLYEQGKMNLCLAKGAFCIHAGDDGSCQHRSQN